VHPHGEVLPLNVRGRDQRLVRVAFDAVLFDAGAFSRGILRFIALRLRRLDLKEVREDLLSRRRMYILTARRMISGDSLKYLNAPGPIIGGGRQDHSRPQAKFL